MIRPFTFVCAVLAGASGLYLYSEKHRTTLLDQQISGIVVDTQHIRERTAMLRAEWALLNQPDRLQALSTRFLPQLQAMAPTQFVQMASLDARLPPAGPETPPHPITTPRTAPALVGAEPSAAAPAAVADGAAIARLDAAQPATRVARVATPERATAARIAAHAGAPAHREIELADNGNPQPVPQRAAAAVVVRRAAASHPQATPRTAPVRLASLERDAASRGRPVIATVSSAYAHPPVLSATAWRPARASWSAPRAVGYAAPSYAAPAQQAYASASSLGGGGRSALPAPVPLSDGN